MDGPWSRGWLLHNCSHKYHTRCSCIFCPRNHRTFCTAYIFMAHFMIIVIFVMLKMNLSDTGRSKYILLPKRGNEISERLWFSLSSQAAAGKEILLSCHRDSYATCHSQHAGSEAAQSSINLLRWAANIQSKDLKMSNSTKDESPRNAGSTHFKWGG